MMFLNYKLTSIVLFLTLAIVSCNLKETSTKPNIIICIADDVSYPHMGKDLGWINTPAFDIVASEGLFFSNAYTPNGKCAPSRASLLTGRNSWQLEQAANMWAYFPKKFKTYPEALSENGYFVGYTGKRWGPGDSGEIDGKKRELCGKEWNLKKLTPPTKGISDVDYASNFIDFFNNKPKDKPFCFWYGSKEPHRIYEYGSSLKAGKKLSDINEVPAFFPDNEIVRTDMLDYALEIEHFDSQLGQMLNYLESIGELENTIVIVTADNGMPFPHAKTDAYNFSNHVPLSIMWRNGIKSPGRIIDDFVSFIDIAPTLIDIAGIGEEKDCQMQEFTGKSMVPIFENINRKERFRDFVLVGKEKHGIGRPDDAGYPIRGIVKDNMLYLRNYNSERWPVGPPQTGYSNVDGSPTKTEVLKARNSVNTKYLWELSFAKRAKEELYNLKEDPYCINNIINLDDKKTIAQAMKKLMEDELKKEGDPRLFGNGDVFQNYKHTNIKFINAYERIVNEKEKLIPGWINASDIESSFVE